MVKVKYSLAILVFIGHTVEETSDTLSGHIFSLPMSFLGHILFFVHIFFFFWPFWSLLDILLPIERGPSPSPSSPSPSPSPSPVHTGMGVCILRWVCAYWDGCVHTGMGVYVQECVCELFYDGQVEFITKLL